MFVFFFACGVVVAGAGAVPRALISIEGLPGTQSSKEVDNVLFEWSDGGDTVALLASMDALLESADFSASLEMRNNAALAYLLAGETHVADVAFSGLARWCGWPDLSASSETSAEPSSCLAVFKNWCWALAARPQGGDHALWDAVRSLAVSSLETRSSSSALSVYDVGLAGGVCRHASISPSSPVCQGVPNGEIATRLTGDDLYLDLIRRSLTNYVHADFEDQEWGGCSSNSASTPVPIQCEQSWTVAWRSSGISGLASGEEGEEDERARRRYHTTLSVADLIHLELLVRDLFKNKIQGNLLEAGVFRGGACIFLRALLSVTPNESSRRVFVADSFAGIPSQRRSLPGMIEDPTETWTDRFSFGRDAVEYNFRRYGLLDERVTFVPGFFNESLPSLFARPLDGEAPKLALLRIDADAYDGVLDALTAAFPHLSPGGAVVIDDWHLTGARLAVHEYRKTYGITTPILPLPSDYVYTCTAPPLLSALDECQNKRHLFDVHNKHLITGIGQHAAYWRKPLEM